MTKSKRSKSLTSTANTTINLNPQPTTLSQLKQDSPLITYKLHVLLYDLHNIAKAPSSQKRLDATTDVQYLSDPYFNESESIGIKTALVNIDLENEVSEDSEFEEGNLEKMTENEFSNIESQASSTVPIESALTHNFKNFITKRKASGDYRPCGPHTMGPIYLSVFDIQKSELENEFFLSRLRRSGLGDAAVVDVSQGSNEIVAKKGGKKGGKGR